MIVDTSVAFKWVFVEEDSEAAVSLIGRNDLFAPSLLLIELGNALRQKARNGELGDRPAYSTKVALVASLVTLIDSADVVSQALDLALRIDHAIYDCIYLALAEQRRDKLITADKRFAAKAKLAGAHSAIQLLSEFSGR